MCRLIIILILILIIIIIHEGSGWASGCCLLPIDHNVYIRLTELRHNLTFRVIFTSISG